MRVLDRKLLRNLGTMRLQIVAIVLIIACGVASFVTMLTAYRGLKQSRDAYYGRYRMADLWAPVKRMPRSSLRKLEAVEGVRRVAGRITSKACRSMTLDVRSSRSTKTMDSRALQWLSSRSTSSMATTRPSRIASTLPSLLELDCTAEKRPDARK